MTENVIRCVFYKIIIDIMFDLETPKFAIVTVYIRLLKLLGILDAMWSLEKEKEEQ